MPECLHIVTLPSESLPEKMSMSSTYSTLYASSTIEGDWLRVGALGVPECDSGSGIMKLFTTSNLVLSICGQSVRNFTVKVGLEREGALLILVFRCLEPQHPTDSCETGPFCRRARPVISSPARASQLAGSDRVPSVECYRDVVFDVGIGVGKEERGIGVEES